MEKDNARPASPDREQERQGLSGDEAKIFPVADAAQPTRPLKPCKTRARAKIRGLSPCGGQTKGAIVCFFLAAIIPAAVIWLSRASLDDRVFESVLCGAARQVAIVTGATLAVKGIFSLSGPRFPALAFLGQFFSAMAWGIGTTVILSSTEWRAAEPTLVNPIVFLNVLAVLLVGLGMLRQVTTRLPAGERDILSLATDVGDAILPSEAIVWLWLLAIIEPPVLSMALYNIRDPDESLPWRLATTFFLCFYLYEAARSILHHCHLSDKGGCPRRNGKIVHVPVLLHYVLFLPQFVFFPIIHLGWFRYWMYYIITIYSSFWIGLAMRHISFLYRGFNN
ncbi:MAG: hypothetical protein LBP92_12120 [Deltaproteobacteria bacterium]|jgi:hypothetical protein|nr:hypothetical protein [Deltaproteobacteria bacterium]